MAARSHACVHHEWANPASGNLRNLCSANAFAFVNVEVNGFAVDFRFQKQLLLARAERVEKKARREKNAQAQDIMRALALLYREMANELVEGSIIPSYMLDPRLGYVWRAIWL